MDDTRELGERERQQTLVVAIWKRSKLELVLSPNSFVRGNTCSMNKINLIRYYYVSELFKPVFPFVRDGSEIVSG